MVASQGSDAAHRPSRSRTTGSLSSFGSAHVRRPCKANISRAFAESPKRTTSSGQFWSQQYEDQFFRTYFFTERERVHGKIPGTYIELGANDGSVASNTRHFYAAHGWRGLLVEASPPLCERLAKNRPGDVVLCGAVCDYNISTSAGFVRFATAAGSGSASLVGHVVNQGSNAEWSATSIRQHKLTTFSVPCAPLGSMLASSGIAYADFFSLDVEQNELRVLNTIDFRAFRFAVGVIELECPGRVTPLSVQDAAVRALLARHGYTYVMRQRGNDVWIDERVLWAKRGAERVQAALRSRLFASSRLAVNMIDRRCCDGHGASVQSRWWLYCGRVEGARGSHLGHHAG